MMDFKMVLLKTGKYVPDTMIFGTWLDLRREIQESPLGIFELVKCCQDRKYRFPEKFLEEFANVGLVLPEGIPQSDVREIVLASVEGEGMEMVFHSPLHEREKHLEDELWKEDIYITSSIYWLENWINE